MTVTVPPGQDRQIVCTFTDILHFRKLAELPLTSLKFSKVLNGVGPWSGSLKIEDERFRQADWLTATDVQRSAVWIDIGGVPVYGGATLQRNYAESAGVVSLAGSDFCYYLAQRLQEKDYLEYTDPEGHDWFRKGAPAMSIAYFVLRQAMTKEGSIPLRIARVGAEGEWVTISLPITQAQTLSSILGQLQEAGYTVGIDYACDVFKEGDVRVAQITLSYPRRGFFGPGPPVIDVANALDFTWDEDGTAQANSLVEMAGATTIRSSKGLWKAAIEAGYPLLESTTTHPALAPSEAPITLLEAYLSGDLSISTYPAIAPVITLHLFGQPSIFELNAGDDALLRLLPNKGNFASPNPRFPKGLEIVMRIVRIDVEIPNEGVPTMALTLNLPPSQEPVEPPETTGGSLAKEPEGWGAREKEREEKEAKEKEAKEKEEKEKEEKEKEEGFLGEGAFVLTSTVTAEGVITQVFPIMLSQEPANLLPVKAGSSASYTYANIKGEHASTYDTVVNSVTPALPGGTVRLVITQTAGPEVEISEQSGIDLLELISGTEHFPEKLGESVTATYNYKAYSK